MLHGILKDGGGEDDDDVAVRYFSVAFVNGVIKEISVRIMGAFTQSGRCSQGIALWGLYYFVLLIDFEWT